MPAPSLRSFGKEAKRLFLVRVGPSRWLSVHEILSRWYGEDFIYVKVRTEDERLCVLRYDAPTDRWTVALAPVRQGDWEAVAPARTPQEA